MDFTVDEGVLNYITPPPPKNPPLEEKNPKRFTIPQLNCTKNEFKMMKNLSSSKDGKIDVDFLYNFLKSRQNNSMRFHGTNTTIPMSLQEKSPSQFMQMIRNLDPESTGHVDQSQLLTYFILLTSSIPTEQ